MKQFTLVTTLIFALFLSHSLHAQEQKIYVFDIKDDIDEPVWRTTRMALEEAKKLDADHVFIQMNTYGGAVYVADSIRTAILEFPKPVYVLIENNAASAGAFISLACDSIFMRPGAVMGAATVVNQNGEQVPDKYQSFMRTKMRATAEQNGRNPNIAEAMVDPDIEVEGVSEKGKVLTLTTSEALKVDFCDGEFENIEQALDFIGIDDYTITKQRLTLTDEIIGWLVSPAISGILILVIFGGIYFEMQSPGLGAPIGIAILAAVLYFAPLYLEGLADNWEIVVFAIGIILIALEIFVIPGFGIAGIAGIILTILGLSFSMVGNVGLDFSFLRAELIARAFFVSIISSTISILGSILLAAKLFEGGALSSFVLQAEQKKEDGYIGTSTKEFELIGCLGVAYTNLRPSGKVEINNDLYDATAITGFIEKGTKIKVIQYDTAQIKVRAVESTNLE